MKRFIQKLVLCCAVAGLLLYGFAAFRGRASARAAAAAAPAPQATPASTNPAMDDAAKVMWLAFISANLPSGQPPASGDSVPAAWESWSTDLETFPGNGVADAPCFPNHPNPQYRCDATAAPSNALAAPQPGGVRKRIREGGLQQQLIVPLQRANAPRRTLRGSIANVARGRNLSLRAAAKTANTTNPVFNGNDLEEVARNQAAFDYIVQSNLYTVAGLTQQFNNNFEVKFPVDAVEVKARWMRWSDITQQRPGAQKANYHTTTALDPQTNQPNVFGLVGFHIMTKDIPNWVWATWEQEDNPGMCDYIGCHDDFGMTPANIPPNAQAGQPYQPGTLTPELLQLMNRIGPEWQHYRMKGAQNDFVDPAGQPLIVGNSVTEDGFVQTSSCMTCHALASFAPPGKTLPIFTSAVTPPAGDSTVAFYGVPGITCPTPRTCTQGPPGAGFYLNPFDPIKNPKGPSKRQYMTTDFVWAIPFLTN